jgi:hypothetical protein
MANLNEAQELGVPDLLNALKGREATLLLSNGTSVTGTIKDGVNYAAALTKSVIVIGLEGRDYFNAAIPVKEITGFIFRGSES